MKKLEELKRKYEELGKEIERLEGKVEERWRAYYQGEYWYIDIDGDI